MTSRAASPPRPAIVLDHVTITVADLERGRRCYDAILAPLGLTGAVEYLDPEGADEVGAEALGYGRPNESVLIWLVVGPGATRSAHFALRTTAVDVVDAFVAAALAAELTVSSAPRSTPFGRGHAASAIVTDPDGNLIEAFVDPTG